MGIGYWDIHNHILPGVDDGAGYYQEAIELIEEEYKQGIRHIVMTPHYRPKMFEVSAADRQAEFQRFCQKVGDTFPGMHYYLGCENYVHRGLLEQLKNTNNLMNGKSVVLLEFPTKSEFLEITQMVLQVIQAGITPILAHVERYQALVADEERVRHLVELGALIQVNAETVMGSRFNRYTRFVHSLLGNGLVHFIASDAHDMKYRPVQMSKCMKVIQRKYGSEAVETLFRKNQEKLFQNR